MSEEFGFVQLAMATTMLACLPGGDTDAAVLAVAEAGDVYCPTRLRWLLFEATGDREHLKQAKSTLDQQLAKVPNEYHEAMCTSVRVNRQILAAWEEHVGGV